MYEQAAIAHIECASLLRDGLGRYEDKFFSSVFLGSGLLFLAMMFVSTAVAAGLVASNVGVTDPSAHAETIQFGKMVMLAASQTYAVRMAAVFMMSLANDLASDGLDATLAGWPELSGCRLHCCLPATSACGSRWRSPSGC